MKNSASQTRAITGAIALSFLIVFFQNCSESQLVLPSKAPVQEKLSCVGPKGETVADGESLKGYFQNSQVGCSEVCAEKVMTCDDGKMQGASGQVISNAEMVSSTSATCQATCDHRTETGHEATGLIAGKPYLVSVYGVTRNKGTGNTTLVGPRVEDCAGNPLADSTTSNVNWHDGQAPQSHTFAVTAPASGCVRGFVDGDGNGEALNLTVSEQKEVGSVLASDQATGLSAGQKYLVSVYGILRNQGQGNVVVNAAEVQTCLDSTIEATDSQTINWPDGHTPHSMTFAVNAPNDGCVQGIVDSGDATDITVQKVLGDARTEQGNQINGLTANAQYLVSVYGYTTTITNENTSDILDPVQVTSCDGLEILAQTAAPTINWHDGSTPMNGTLAITAPNDGCIQATVDANPATTISVFQIN